MEIKKIVSLHLETVLKKEKVHKLPENFFFSFSFVCLTIELYGLEIVIMSLKFLLLLIEGMRYSTTFLGFMVLS